MGNILTLEDEELEKKMREMGVNNEEQIMATKTLLRDEGLRNIFSNFEKNLEKIDDDLSSKEEEFLNLSPPVYEGNCGFLVSDTEGQKILDKYLPRNLNSHATDMLNIFSTTTFRDLRESSDRYPENSFWSTPLNWVFLAHDPDFQVFFNKEPIDIDDMVQKTHHNRQIFREVLTYIFSFRINI